MYLHLGKPDCISEHMAVFCGLEATCYLRLSSEEYKELPNVLNYIAFECGDDFTIPIFVFTQEQIRYHPDFKGPEDKPIIVLFKGNDNSSYFIRLRNDYECSNLVYHLSSYHGIYCLDSEYEFEFYNS